LKTNRKRKNIFAPGRKIYRHRRHHWRVGEDRPGKQLGRTSTQWCSKTTKLQDQDHLIFQDQDRFLKTIKLLTQDHWRSQKFW